MHAVAVQQQPAAASSQQPAQDMTIRVTSLDGNIFEVDVPFGATVADLKKEAEAMGYKVPRLICQCRDLLDSDLASHRTDQHRTDQHRVFVAMTLHGTAPTDYLLLHPKARSCAPVPLYELQQMAKAKKATGTLKVFDTNILQPGQFETLCDFLEVMFSRSTNTTNSDMKMVISSQQLRCLLMQSNQGNASTAKQQVDQLLALYQPANGHPAKAKLAFRITKASSAAACVNWNCDSSLAAYTTQVTLNDASTDFKGGQLVFYDATTNQVICPELHRGTAVRHEPNILHAVTRLVSGTRMVLFVLDESNRRNEDMRVVKHEDIDDFLNGALDEDDDDEDDDDKDEDDDEDDDDKDGGDDEDGDDEDGDDEDEDGDDEDGDDEDEDDEEDGDDDEDEDDEEDGDDDEDEDDEEDEEAKQEAKQDATKDDENEVAVNKGMAANKGSDTDDVSPMKRRR